MPLPERMQMATKGAIAIQREQAMARIEAAMSSLNALLDVDEIPLPKVSRYPELLHNEQLEAVAMWAERVVEAAAVAVGVNGEAAEPLEAQTSPEFDDQEIWGLAEALGVFGFEGSRADLITEIKSRTAGNLVKQEAAELPIVEPSKPDYSELTVEELEALLDERGIDRDAIKGSGKFDRVVKADLMAALEVHDEAALRMAATMRVLHEQQPEEDPNGNPDG